MLNMLNFTSLYLASMTCSYIVNECVLYLNHSYYMVLQACVSM